ncbi:uncharacterized protein LOC115877619 [Sitophilus oryzae]|uniref:Uncharacterized protein LOC115877619 n=1 Tax=Sitophilus oryzae TaxID=7048 RepID=A0A6J2XF12_SITOR|nr:uncharacterized protein LOC115877619 [Sitophilus oryzae]
MSYANRKERIFKDGERWDIPHSRSESRMKKYWSATDRRAWCDEVELRRQHILELIAKNRGQFCLESLIPLGMILNIMAATRDAENEDLQKRIDSLEAQLAVYKDIDLTEEQQKEVDALIKKYNIKPPED